MAKPIKGKAPKTNLLKSKQGGKQVVAGKSTKGFKFALSAVKKMAEKVIAPKKAVAVKESIPKRPAKKVVELKVKGKKTIGLGLQQAIPAPEKVTPYLGKKGEEYMNDAQRGHFREILLNWKKQIMQEADDTVKHLQEEVTAYADLADRASREEEFNLELRTRDRERKLLKKIEEALERIDNKEYGYCDDCGAEIGIRRLEARPTATQCIECKTIAEIKEKQIGEGS
jgi:DnaK suppressor protein